jgi:hypothetical protein
LVPPISGRAWLALNIVFWESQTPAPVPAPRCTHIVKQGRQWYGRPAGQTGPHITDQNGPCFVEPCPRRFRRSNAGYPDRRRMGPVRVIVMSSGIKEPLKNTAARLIGTANQPWKSIIACKTLLLEVPVAGTPSRHSNVRRYVPKEFVNVMISHPLDEPALAGFPDRDRKAHNPRA